ncbi:MAG: hypothetical protein LBT01_00685 [Spirochaetaceae bacterium]|jgi:hypothetical protein|nr:hypothetical protein [Spirochaetaceae bacterium]
MFKKIIFGLTICFTLAIMLISCGGGAQVVSDTTIPGVIVTRSDGLTTKIEVYVDGERTGTLAKGGKFGQKLMNGRHTVSVVHQGIRSRVLDFYIQSNRQNFSVTAFEGSGPTIRPF